MGNEENAGKAVSEEMIRYVTEVCKKYSTIKTLAEEAEASWKQNIEMAETSKYPAERAMYVQQAGEELARYNAAQEWMKIVDMTVLKIRDTKTRLVLRQNCLAGATMKSILLDKKSKTYMSRSTATRHKKKGLEQMASLLPAISERLNKLEKKIAKVDSL